MRRICLVFAVLLSVAALASAQPLPSLYVPLNPCRVLDTRAEDGPYFAGSTHYLLVRGSCNVPQEATAVALTVVAFAPAGSGHLKLWESSLPTPTASSMNFRSGPGSDSSYLTPRLCYPVAECAGEDLAIFTSQDTDVIADVVGYFVAALPSAE